MRVNRLCLALSALACAHPALAQADEAPAPPAASGPAPFAAAANTRVTADELLLGGDPFRLLPLGRVPNLGLSPVAGLAAPALSVRGLGNSATLAPLPSAVGSFVDGVPLGAIDVHGFALFDLGGVELRRGGQGAALGRGTSGGALLVTLDPPADVFGGLVGGGWGAYDRKMARGSVDVPLGAIGLKFSAYVADDDGVARNRTTGEKLNDQDRAGLRLAARIAPADTLSLTASVAHVEDKGEGLLSFACNPLAPDDCSGRSSTTGLLKARRLGGGPQYGLPVAGTKARQTLGSLVATTLVNSNLEWRLGDHRLALVSGFVDHKISSALDFSDGRGLPVPGAALPPVRGFADGGFTSITDGASQQHSQELSLAGSFLDGRLSYRAGGQLIDLDERLDMADLLTRENGTPLGALELLADRIARTDSRALAGFATATLAVGALSLEGGLRYTHEERRFALTDTRCGTAGCLATSGEIDSGIWTPHAAASLQVAEGLTLFARAARGWRPGGWAARATRADALAAFAPETAWTYEGGATARAFDDRLDARLTLFALEVRNFQGADTGFAGATPQLVAGTLGDWRNRGVEVELAARPADGLSLGLSLGLQDDAWKLTPALRAQQAACLAGAATACGTGIVRADGSLAQPAQTPDVSAGFTARWAFAIPAAGIILTPRLDVLWRSGFFTDTANLAGETGAHALVDGVIAIETDDSNWLMTLSCSNCLGSDAAQSSLFGWTYPAAPRQWLLSARRRF